MCWFVMYGALRFSYIHHYVQFIVHSYTWYCTKGSSHIVKVEKQKSVSLDSSIVLIGCVCMRVADSPVYYYYYNIVQIGKRNKYFEKEINRFKKTFTIAMLNEFHWMTSVKFLWIKRVEFKSKQIVCRINNAIKLRLRLI